MRPGSNKIVPIRLELSCRQETVAVPPVVGVFTQHEVTKLDQRAGWIGIVAVIFTALGGRRLGRVVDVEKGNFKLGGSHVPDFKPSPGGYESSHAYTSHIVAGHRRRAGQPDHLSGCLELLGGRAGHAGEEPGGVDL